jgi:PAS domain S-box-containing protein
MVARYAGKWQKQIMRKFFKQALASLIKKLKVTEDLRLEKERFDVLVKAVEDYAIFTLDTTGHVKSWNAGAQSFKGYKPEEILGKHFSIFYPKTAPPPDAELDYAREHGRFREEGLRVRKDGSMFWAYVVITAIYDENRNLTGFLKVTRDISEKKAAEESLRKMNEELEQRVKDRTAIIEIREKELKVAKESAEAANLAKSTFVANMSHEIRTPLGAILGFAEILGDADLSSEERMAAKDAIQRNSQLLSALIDDVLDLSKVEADKLELESSPLDIIKAIDDIQVTFAANAEAKGVKFVVDRDPNIPRWIITDPLRLKQILYNVLSNASKFTKQGEIHLSVKTNHPNLLSFSVTDTGIGISDEQAANLFKPFQQADRAITREYGGTGLGLILSKRLAQALGGDLVLSKSIPGVGSTFTATVRLVPVNESVATPRLSEDMTEGFAGKKILVVDDNPDNRTLLMTILKKWKVQVSTANDGADGVSKAMSLVPDLILMDLQMPVQDGASAVRELRGLNFEKPIVALTAHALKQERDKCLAEGFNAYLTKPIDKFAFTETLSKFLNP